MKEIKCGVCNAVVGAIAEAGEMAVATIECECGNFVGYTRMGDRETVRDSKTLNEQGQEVTK